MLKLHVGCGDIYFKDWVNIDLESKMADLRHDVSKSLPYDDRTASFIYSEHFIEHLDVDSGVSFLREACRVLDRDGILRIATLDLDYLALKYFFAWKQQDWISRYHYTHIQNNAEMINVALRYWGHQWVYNFTELSRRLKESGFKHCKRVRFGKSQHVCLRGLETRKDSKLIVEAFK